MRRDVKVGLAVGVVLFAVLVTYLLVNTGGGSTSQHPGEPLAVATGGEQAPAAPEQFPSAERTLPAPVDPPPAPAPVAAAGAPDQWDDLLWGRAHLPPAGNVARSVTPDPIRIPSPEARNNILDPAPVRTNGAGPAPASRPARTHVIQAGESPWTIAQAAYGNGVYSAAIIKANPNLDPQKLRVGMKINLPDPADVVGASPTTRPTGVSADHSAPGPVDANTQYRVQENDSLYTIAAKLYGRSDRWDKIYEANKQMIGEDPHRLKVGWILKLPEKPMASGEVH